VPDVYVGGLENPSLERNHDNTNKMSETAKLRWTASIPDSGRPMLGEAGTVLFFSKNSQIAIKSVSIRATYDRRNSDEFRGGTHVDFVPWLRGTRPFVMPSRENGGQSWRPGHSQYGLRGKALVGSSLRTYLWRSTGEESSWRTILRKNWEPLEKAKLYAGI